MKRLETHESWFINKFISLRENKCIEVAVVVFFNNDTGETRFVDDPKMINAFCLTQLASPTDEYIYEDFAEYIHSYFNDAAWDYEEYKSVEEVREVC